MAIEMTTRPMTREQMLAAFQPLPAGVTSKRHRLEYLLDDVILASKDDPETNRAAWYLRGRIWMLVQQGRQTLAQVQAQVVDAVLARREIEQATEEECRRMNLEFTLEYRMRQREQGMIEEDHPQDILDWVEALLSDQDDAEEMTFVFALEELQPLCAPCRLCGWVRPWHQLVDGLCEDCREPEPTTPASAHPVTPEELAEAISHYDVWEQAQTFWSDYDQALPHILNHWAAFCANWADEGMEEERDEWESHQRELAQRRTYRAARAVA